MVRLRLIKCILLIILALSSWGASCFAVVKPVVISISKYDINRDRVEEIFEILMESGRRVNDFKMWCGNGDKWEGQFQIRVRRGSRVLYTAAISRMLPQQKIFFWAPQPGLVFQDHNRDGQIDFNLGQYHSCNGNLYNLFTVNPRGIITPLPIRGKTGLYISPPSRRNSSNLIEQEKGYMTVPVFDIKTRMYLREYYKWDGTGFVKVRTKRL